MKERVLVIILDYSSWPEWPVGMAYVLACLDNYNIPFDFIDCTTTKNYNRVLQKKLQKEDYFAVASGGLIGCYRFFEYLRNMVTVHSPEIPFVLGGQIIKDGNNKLLFETIGIDYGIVGEAETSFGDFLYALAKGEKKFNGYTGVFCKGDDGKVVRNKQLRLDLSKENIIPAWHYFDYDYYINQSSFAFLGKNLRYIPVLSGRGCIGKCGFCSPSVGGFKKRPIAHVLEEIKFIIDNYDFDLICFLNEMFYPTVKEIKEFCHAYMKMEKTKEWFVQVRIDANLDEETLVLMRKSGCVAVSAGIESGSNDILKKMNKKITVEQIRRHFRNCRKAKMPASGTVIVGYDGETEADIKKTFDLLIEEDIYSGEALLFAYQGTAVYEKACKVGLIPDEDKHLDALCGDLFRPNVMEEFCNLTKMSDETFFPLAQQEVRRYNLYLIGKYAVNDLNINFDKGLRWTKINMKGFCSVCGSELNYDSVIFGGEFLGSLGPGVNRMIACRNCFSPAIFNPYTADNFSDMQMHLENIKQLLLRKKSVLIYGINNNLDFLLRSDLFGLDYSAIKGIISLVPNNFVKYIDYPVLNERTIGSVKADCILVVDDSARSADITALFGARGNTVPEIIYLTSDKYRSALNKNSCLVFKINQFMKAWFKISAREVVNKLKFWS